MEILTLQCIVHVPVVTVVISTETGFTFSTSFSAVASATYGLILPSESSESVKGG